MIFMIVVNGVFLLSLEDIDYVCSFFKEEYSYKEDYQKVADKIFKPFLTECYYADKRLQKMVNKRLGDDFVSLVIIPTNANNRLDVIHFELSPKKDDMKIKKRHKNIHRGLCNICFKDIEPVLDRLYNYYWNK